MEAPKPGAGGGVRAAVSGRAEKEVSGDQKTLWVGEGPGLCPGTREPQKYLSRAVTCVRCMFRSLRDATRNAGEGWSGEMSEVLSLLSR